MRKATLAVIILVILVAASAFLIRASRGSAQNRTGFETQPAHRGDLQVIVDADGVVRSAQSASLTWRTSGTVESVDVRLGESVSSSQVLASLEQTSLPQALLLAQTDLIDAQRALDDLLKSQVEQKQAQQTLEDTRHALEDALQPQSAQARAQAAVAQAQKAVETAGRNLEIVQSTASQQAIASAYGTVLLWGNALERTRTDIERVQRKLKQSSATMTGSSHDFYQNLLQNLLLQGVNYQRSYEDARQRYQDLLKPPDPVEIAQAESHLALAQAQLEQVQREYERVKDGQSPADLAVLQAKLDDARREADRLKDGPDPGEVAAAQARLAAAQATLNLGRQTAPFSGVVTRVEVKPGDQVTPGSPAFRIDDLSSLLLEVKASEIDINRIQVGQRVTIKLDAVPDKEYTGEVVEVPGVGDEVNNVVSFAVKVEIKDADSHIRPEMTASAVIVLAELKDVLLVPSQAVRYVDGQRLIYVLRNGQPEQVNVRLGASSAEDVQVLEGDLQPGELVVLNPED
jgi:HlyD family secretion protein